jgi:hypothetical protein
MKQHPNRNERPPALTPPFAWAELYDVSGRQEVHYRLIALFHGEQLRDLHVSASARSPPRCFPHLFPERSLLVFPSAAVAEEVFPCLGRSASSSFRLSPVRKQIQKVSGLRREPTLKVWQSFRLSAGFCCKLPFAQIHFQAFIHGLENPLDTRNGW